MNLKLIDLIKIDFINHIGDMEKSIASDKIVIIEGVTWQHMERPIAQLNFQSSIVT